VFLVALAGEYVAMDAESGRVVRLVETCLVQRVGKAIDACECLGTVFALTSYSTQP
jgi:hypothetical protein